MKTYCHCGKKLGDYRSTKCSSCSKKGRKHSEITKKKLSKTWFKKGHTPWSKGKKCPQLSGENNGFYGKHHTEKLKKKISKKLKILMKGRIVTWGDKISKANKGKHHSPETELKKGQWALEKHPVWQGGKSFEPYGLEFNNKLKEFIRERDNFTCQECRHTQKQLGYKLPVHHRDYNKQNNNPNNLISLCHSCHAQTNYDRQDWINYFQNKLGMEQ